MTVDAKYLQPITYIGVGDLPAGACVVTAAELMARINAPNSLYRERLELMARVERDALAIRQLAHGGRIARMIEHDEQTAQDVSRNRPVD